MNAVFALLCGLVVLCAPGTLLAQEETTEETTARVPIGAEARSEKLLFESGEGTVRTQAPGQLAPADIPRAFHRIQRVCDGTEDGSFAARQKNAPGA